MDKDQIVQEAEQMTRDQVISYYTNKRLPRFEELPECVLAIIKRKPALYDFATVVWNPLVDAPEDNPCSRGEIVSLTGLSEQHATAKVDRIRKEIIEKCFKKCLVNTRGIGWHVTEKEVEKLLPTKNRLQRSHNSVRRYYEHLNSINDLYIPFVNQMTLRVLNLSQKVVTAFLPKAKEILHRLSLPEPVAKRRKMSAIGRERISIAARARWARYRSLKQAS